MPTIFFGGVGRGRSNSCFRGETQREKTGNGAQAVALPGQGRRGRLPARSIFYRCQGFDVRLTSLPEPVFVESLALTGITDVQPSGLKGPPQSGDEDWTSIRRNRMQYAYSLIWDFENRLRDFLQTIMTAGYGLNWEKGRTSPDTVEAWRRKRQKALHRGEPDRPLIHFADFTDYAKVLTRRDSWRDVFSKMFQDEEDLRTSFRRLEPIRVCVMHSRPITKDDFLILVVEVKRTLKAIADTQEHKLDR